MTAAFLVSPAAPEPGRLDVVTFGEAMALYLAELGVPLDLARTFRASVAGAESTVAIGLARLGHSVGWFGRVGADGPGRAVLAAIRAAGVDTSRVLVDGAAPTGLLIRDCPAAHPIEVVYHRAGSAGSRLAEVDDAYLASARVLHWTGITPLLSDSARAATEAAVRAASAADLVISFDPNIRRRLAPLDRILPLLRTLSTEVDIVLASADEAALLAGTDDPHGAAAWFLGRGARLVVLKDGVRGSWATDGDREWRAAAHPVRTVDPVGAGDAYAAGFLSAWLRGRPVPDALREAATVAGLAVAVPGDIEGLPTAAQRDTALAGESDVDR